MPIYSWLIGGCWGVFVVYWMVSAVGIKRRISGDRHRLVRVAVLVVVILVVRSRKGDLNAGFDGTIGIPAVRWLGVLLCASGISYAIWARRHIGRNWGMPMSVVESPELVTSGPYARIRHPIYTGMLLALVGSALALSLWWLVGAVAALVYFGYAARREEETMLAAFPETYPDYRRRTNMIVPFVF